MSKKIVIAGIAVLLIGAFLVWFFTASSKPLPGVKQADMGRKHVTSVKNSSGDLATSGDHYGEWTRAGVYETPLDDGNLIHSLEHGYVILSYRCSDEIGKTRSASESANLTIGNSEACKTLRDQLTKIYEKKGKRKLIIVPRPQMDTKITLYAWNYLLKLDQFDEEKIVQFIDTYRDQGPERTAE